MFQRHVGLWWCHHGAVSSLKRNTFTHSALLFSGSSPTNTIRSTVCSRCNTIHHRHVGNRVSAPRHRDKSGKLGQNEDRAVLRREIVKTVSRAGKDVRWFFFQSTTGSRSLFYKRFNFFMQVCWTRPAGVSSCASFSPHPRYTHGLNTEAAAVKSSDVLTLWIISGLHCLYVGSTSSAVRSRCCHQSISEESPAAISSLWTRCGRTFVLNLPWCDFEMLACEAERDGSRRRTRKGFL